jgi:hypothetical protein
MPSLLAQYRSSLKNPFAEELIDLALYRPLAFLFVKATLPLPLTPNFVSLLAMIAGIGAGVALAGGTTGSFITGALLFGLSNILDCSDGMIARLKKNGTMTGRIVDGLVDYVAHGAVYLGFTIGMARAVASHGIVLPCNPWILMVAAGISTILHSISSDYYRNAFIRREKRGGDGDDEEFRLFSQELARLQSGKGHGLDKVLISIYLKYLGVQQRKKSNAAPQSVHPSVPEHKAVTPLQAVLWNLIGPSTHVTFIILAAVLYRPMVFFIFDIAAANVWMIGLFIIQAVVMSKDTR